MDFFLTCLRCGINNQPIEDQTGQDASGIVGRHVANVHRLFSFGAGIVVKDIPKLGIKITDHTGEEIILR